jgi:hypothetical protein
MASFKPLALALFLVPASLAAQDATAPEFHAGQWALQFGGNLDLATFGIMRFSGPRSALVLNFDVAGQFLKGTLTQSSVGVSDANDHTFLFRVSVGRQSYHPIRAKVRAFHTIGLTGAYVDQRNTLGVGFDQKYKAWSGGLLAQAGGAYWLSSNISLGGTASFSAEYTHRHTTQNAGGGTSELKQHGVVLVGPDVALVLGIYF